VVYRDNKIFSVILSTEGVEEGSSRVYDASGQLVPLANRIQPTTVEGEEMPWPITNVYYIPGYGSEHIYYSQHFVYVRGIAFQARGGRVHATAINGDLIDLAIPTPSIGFEGRELWGSYRGFIWSRTFPLMPARTIIGSGPDTYTFVFPQNDLIGKLRFMEAPYTTVDKAHNIYLQTWITTGGISALALIFLFGYYILTSFMSILRSHMEEGIFLFGLRFGLLAGISAFCVSAMATDSTIGSSGVFYVMLGLGYGINYIVKRVNKTGGQPA